MNIILQGFIDDTPALIQVMPKHHIIDGATIL